MRRGEQLGREKFVFFLWKILSIFPSDVQRGADLARDHRTTVGVVASSLSLISLSYRCRLDFNHRIEHMENSGHWGLGRVFPPFL